MSNYLATDSISVTRQTSLSEHGILPSNTGCVTKNSRQSDDTAYVIQDNKINLTNDNLNSNLTDLDNNNNNNNNNINNNNNNNNNNDNDSEISITEFITRHTTTPHVSASPIHSGSQCYYPKQSKFIKLNNSPYSNNNNNNNNNSRPIYSENFSSPCSSKDVISNSDNDDILNLDTSINSNNGILDLDVSINSNKFNSLSFKSTYLIKYRPNLTPIAVTASFEDVWDSNNVKMPCSIKNKYFTTFKQLNGSLTKQLSSRWSLIESCLSLPITTVHEIEETILSYNSDKGRRFADFMGFHTYFSEYASLEEKNNFFQTILPKLCKLAINLPTLVTKALPLLKKESLQEVTLSQLQIGCLLANAFFCTFPRRNTLSMGAEYANYPSINFNTLYNADNKRWFPNTATSQDTSNCILSPQKAAKIRCIIHYFTRILTDLPAGCVTFRRQKLENPFDWSNANLKFSKLTVNTKGTIEDNGNGMLQVDFANKMIGGGVLGKGLVQEEIRFLINPELILSRLITECLEPHESLIMIGSERYSNYTGYSDSFRWADNHLDITPIDNKLRRKTVVVGIDAMIVRKYTEQFRPWALRRELDKALSGFLIGDYDDDQILPVATGNWGCGAFNGDKFLKALLQLMAASVVGRDVFYFTFEDENLKLELEKIYEFLIENKLKVNDLWMILCDYYRLIKNTKSESFLALSEYIYTSP